jgi:hypothetical protein
MGCFGGRLIYKDSSANTFARPNRQKPAYRSNAARNGKPWIELQERLAALKPITEEQIQDCADDAAYDYKPVPMRKAPSPPLLELVKRALEGESPETWNPDARRALQTAAVRGLE